MQQKNVKQFLNIKQKLAVCPKTAARSQKIRINRESFFCPNFPKNEFWGSNYETLSTGFESVIPIYNECQFSGKTDNFDFSGPNLPKKKKIDLEVRISRM